MEIEITKELIKAIPLAALVGSAFTLLGVLYTNSQNRKRMEQQHMFQMEEKNKEIYLQKAEELYENLEIWNSQIFTAYESMIQKTSLNISSLDVSTKNRIRTLSGLYFPNLESDINTAFNSCSGFYMYYEMLFENNPNAVFEEDEIDLLNSNVNEISEKIHLLKVKLRNEI